ncbi:hypothetical protein GCM10010968_12230 [Agrococcus terreus]|uniref:Uncharacterized protein n=1 Tax=Agrococcus terreus TaxID=574649 RepID=A0ABQ2KGS6_9MICO|nr:hypothetical protein GCM10010968_12230 [Agrococcus terreus]
MFALGSEPGSAITSALGLAATETSAMPATASSDRPDSTPRVRVERAERWEARVNTIADDITER